jgi:hypothetical protein
LVVSLGILMAMTLIALAAVQTSVMELRMASNTEDNAAAFQTAQAMLSYVISDNTHLTGAKNEDFVEVVLPVNTAFEAAAEETMLAEASMPRQCQPPPRIRAGTSLAAYSAFHYEIRGTVDKTESGRGRSKQNLGYIVLGPKC